MTDQQLAQDQSLWRANLETRQGSAPPYECEQHQGICPVTELREALAREAALLRERDRVIETQKTLSREADHRFLNNLQMVSSLMSVQGRRAANPEAGEALTLAAERVATIGRIHRHLHSQDGVESVAFNRFLIELCRDLMRLTAQDGAARDIVVEGSEVELATTIGIPLGFIAAELITNAIKYGHGPITVSLGPDPHKGLALSVENAGPALPVGFDPAQSKGSGMRIIRSFVGAIRGQLCIEHGPKEQGARFTVLFAAA